MKSYKPSDVRTIGLFGHRGSGKTMLAESMLYTAHITKRLGSVDNGNLALELDEVALERQTTMHANVGYVEWEGRRFSILDTPGDGNFWGATHRALHVVDAAIVTVSALDGIETMTLRVIQELSKRNVPFAVVITKLDKELANFDEVVGEIKSELPKDAVPVSIPVNSGADLKGVFSLLSQKAWLTTAGETKHADTPADMGDVIESARELVFDAVAAADDELAEKYLEEETLSEVELNRGLRAAFGAGDLIPVLASSPTLNVGAVPLLNLVAEVFPSPLERPPLKGYDSTKLENVVERPPDPDGPLVLQVFRTFHDPFAGALSFARVWSGTVKASEEAFNTRMDSTDRPSHIYYPLGGSKTGIDIKEASVGDLIVITKLKSTTTGDTLCRKGEYTHIPPFEEPAALLSYGLSAKITKEEDKLGALVHKIVEEDPCYRFERDPESNQMLLGGLGQAHIDYVVERLKRAGIEVNLREPKVPYRETLRGAVKAIEGKHKKQSGGHGQFGVCFINVDPLSSGGGIEFVDNIVGGAIPRQFIPSVEKGIRDSLGKGPLTGSLIVDLRITLYDGKFHSVDSSDMAFQAAGRKAIKALFDSPKAKPVLLEPYMELDISCPAESVGDVMGDLNSRRARVNNMTTEGRRGSINATVPMNEVLRYTNVLKSLTSGRGSFAMKFDKYQEAPANVQQQVSAAYQAAQSEE